MMDDLSRRVAVARRRIASPDDGRPTTLYRRPRTTREVTDLTEQRSHTNDAI